MEKDDKSSTLDSSPKQQGCTSGLLGVLTSGHLSGLMPVSGTVGRLAISLFKGKDQTSDNPSNPFSESVVRQNHSRVFVSGDLSSKDNLMPDSEAEVYAMKGSGNIDTRALTIPEGVIFSNEGSALTCDKISSLSIESNYSNVKHTDQTRVYTLKKPQRVENFNCNTYDTYFKESDLTSVGHEHLTPARTLVNPPEVENWIDNTSDTSFREDDANSVRDTDLIPVCLFPSTVNEFKPISVGYRTKVFTPLIFFEFGPTSGSKFYVAIATLRSLLISKEKCVRDLPLETLSSSCHSKLKDALEQHGIQFTVFPYTQDIYVNKCDWNTLAKISSFKLGCDLRLSGGGAGVFDIITFMCSLNTSLLQKKSIASCYKNASQRKIRDTKLGVIDTGSFAPSYYSKFSNNVEMNSKMFDATQKPGGCYTGYRDVRDHGSVVVDMLTKTLLPGTKLSVANVAIVENDNVIISSYAVRLAMHKLLEEGVDIINCSFSGCWNDMPMVNNTVNKLQNEGVILVATAGNKSNSEIVSELKTDWSIMVGAHNNNGEISDFSNGKCKADICSLGEVYSKCSLPYVKKGTSFASPFVAALVSNYLQHAQPITSKVMITKLKENLRKSADNIKCECKDHHLHNVALKINPDAFMLTSLDHTVVDISTMIDDSTSTGISSGLSSVSDSCNISSLCIEKSVLAHNFDRLIKCPE